MTEDWSHSLVEISLGETLEEVSACTPKTFGSMMTTPSMAVFITFIIFLYCKCPKIEALSNRCLIYRQFAWCLKFEKMLFLMIFNVPYAIDGA